MLMMWLPYGVINL